MVIGVTMVSVVPGKERNFYIESKNKKYIREVYHVFGEFDFVVIIDAPTLSELNKTVDELRAIEGVYKTHTVVGAEI
ncbi:MAG: Lrp/AsnC ligand binding domain-containing protein [Archaeoglobales archaeon]|nr:Lrp/AsnC ligand binding domain-containing protein [Archaeoglobales archaeon]